MDNYGNDSIKFRDKIDIRLKTTDPDFHTILQNNPVDHNVVLQRNINEARKIYSNTKFHLYVNNIKKT